MFRRFGSLIAIIAIVIVSLAAFTVLAQPAILPSSDDSNSNLTASATDPSSERSQVDPEPTLAARIEPSSTPTVPSEPAAPIEPSPAPPPPESPPSSTPDMSGEAESEPSTRPFSLPDASAAEAQERQVAAPLQLRVPGIGVDTTIEWVGLDDEGNMDVPSGYRTVAWYEHGPNPGMKGNAVVAGHLDSQTGPAVFYRLGDLQPGDEITVVTHDGEELRFVVTGVESFDANSAPLYNIFGASSSANLNLITCEGSFDPNARQYDKRLVVYSTLITS